MFGPSKMRQYLKDNRLFELQADANLAKLNKAQNQNNFNQLSSTESEQQLPSVSRKDGQINTVDMQANMMLMCCGLLFCLLTAAIGFGLFYYFFFDTVRPYIPFLSQSSKITSELFLTQTNAKQYFGKNPLYAGQFHYPRIPVQYWEQRIQMAKSMGLNALGVYVFWNYHQVQKGKYDFTSNNKNLTRFLELVKKHNMTVLLRPGPYVCAEWDFGGLPARLLSVEGLQIRSSNELFMEQVKIYFQQLSRLIRSFVKSQDNPQGPILMLQVQNQPSWFTSQKLYIEKLKMLWQQINIGCPLYFDDTEKGLSNINLSWDNAIIGINPQLYQKGNLNKFESATNFAFGGQIYTGWFSAWGQNKWQSELIQKYNDNFAKQFTNLLSQNKSFSMYMAHGGTNYGLTAGYNITTSYDYSSPISQQGNISLNYHIFRSIIANFSGSPLLSIPDPVQTMKVDLGQTKVISSLFDNLPQALTFDNDQENPLPFQSKQLQMFNQGIVLYETSLKGPKNYTFWVVVHDMALVYLDDQYKGSIQRDSDKGLDKQKKQLNVSCEKKQCRLQIVVQAMGHLNFGQQMKLDKKGLILFKQKSTEKSSFQWKYYRFRLEQELQWKNTEKCQKSPCLYSIQADLEETKDTFIDLKGLTKGYVWVNGYNLGRYWNVGPQHRLYCPGSWLRKGKNNILVLDLFQKEQKVHITGQKQFK